MRRLTGSLVGAPRLTRLHGLWSARRYLHARLEDCQCCDQKERSIQCLILCKVSMSICLQIRPWGAPTRQSSNSLQAVYLC